MSDVDNVRVALRCRPLVDSEIERGCQKAVEKVRGVPQVIVNRKESFTFNYVFDVDDTQELVYNECVLELLDNLFHGFNATILAYGQTGSGKTHTMGTAFDGNFNEHVGVIPRALHDIFRRIEELSSEYEFVVSCSFMELYQEQLFDLLSQKPREESIVDMRENRNGIMMPGLTEEIVKSANETTNCLVRGSAGRAVAATAMNQQSSRSHAIFTVNIKATKMDEMKTITTSKFHLVDLAGSERSKKTQTTGDRFKEGVKINQGLLALGNVISALGSSQNSGFVRYRDSKLTRLLQDSLGGNSVTLMIACVSPADYNVPETLSTLRYADRARQIKNKPIVNQDPHAAEINHLKDIIQQLRLQLLAAGVCTSSSLSSALENVLPSNENSTSSGRAVGIAAQMNEDKSKMYQQLQEKYHTLQQQLQVTLHEVAENEMREHIMEAAHEKIKAQMEEIKLAADEMSHDFKGELSAEELTEHLKSVQKIQKLVGGIDEEFERTQTEICEHKRSFSLSSSMTENCDENNDSCGAVTLEVHALMQEQADVFTHKQMTFKEQLRRINRELSLKMELHQRVAGNLTKFHTLDDTTEVKTIDWEKKIQELETEKTELLDKLKHVKDNASAKLAEERRKRLQLLEQEINEIKRKNLQQAKLLKVREKETQKVKSLLTEIQAMKESKIKLIRAMRRESEAFRKWKMIREKELMQLKNKDRKMQNEMARKEALHTKQRNVLKRKCEESMAINKRLKDALERNRVAQSQRQKMQAAKGGTTSTDKIDQVISWIERELEVILSLIDAEHTLEQLMEDRRIINCRVGELQKQVKTTTEGGDGSLTESAASQELVQLQEEYEMRNAEITDLQQKVCDADLDTRLRSLCENIQSLGEARAVLKHLLKSIMDLRREYTNTTLEHKAALEEQNTLREAAETRCNASAKKMRLLELEHAEAIAERENYYEEKLSLLLHEIYNAPHLAAGDGITPEQEERVRLQEEQLNKMDDMREKLDHYKILVADLQSQLQQQDVAAKTTKTNNKKPKLTTTVIDEEDDIDEILSSDNEPFEADDDPDWKQTPRYRKPSRRHTYKLSNASENSSGLDETYTTATAAANSSQGRSSQASITSTGEGEQHKNKSKFCGCRGKCVNKRCRCYANKTRCTISCRCLNTCQNGKYAADEHPKTDDSDSTEAKAGNETYRKDEEEENIMVLPANNVSPTKGNITVSTTFPSKDAVALPPKIARLSTITFSTPSSKKNFFEY